MTKLNKYTKSTMLGLACLLWGSSVFATVGYFALGYGPKSHGLAGATVSAPQDAMIGAVNPAGIAMVGERFDLSLLAFAPRRDGSLDPRVFGGSNKIKDKSAKNLFFIPGMGFTKAISDKLWFGFTTYANGGLNTTYKRNIYDQTAAVLGALAVGGPAAAASVPSGTGTGAPHTKRLGVDLAQVILAPTLAFKIHPKHTIGISALIGIQYFKAFGLGNFQCFTPTGANNNPAACSPGGFGPLTPGFIGSRSLTNKGRDWAYGAGFRVGWIGEVLPNVTLGGAYTSKIYMSKFDDYKELFAEGGRLDIPAHFQVGISVRPIEPIQISFDFQRILYGDVNAISNPGPVASPFGPSIPSGSGLLGSGNGLGFGWQDINIYRFGLSYQHNEKFSVRAGYSFNDSPIPNDQLLFNILATATITQHATFGLSYSPDDSSEWNLTYVHAFHEGLDQEVSAFGVPASIGMHQNSLEIGYSWKF